MFTGIVEQSGKLVERALTGAAGRLEVEVRPWDEAPEAGESIAVEGVCLTLTEVRGQVLGFDILEETFRRTNLGSKPVGAKLNIERALRHGQPLGGHIVNGHVDGVGAVRAVTPLGRDWILEITCDEEMHQGIVYKGCIACSGVSLTVAEMLGDGFRMHIIPFTWEVTSLCELRPGDPVNLEIDIIGKYVRYYIEERRAVPEVTWELLRERGLAEGLGGTTGNVEP